MIFIGSISYLIPVLIVFVVALAFGFRLLDSFGLVREHTSECGLFACGLSFSLIEFAVFALSLAGYLGLKSAWCLIILAAAAAGRGWGDLRDWATSIAMHAWSSFRSDGVGLQAASTCVALIGSLEALVVMAPLTGSDAMHYHFTVPLLELGKPLYPIFSLNHSFLTGNAHLLISLGLALGSDRVSLGFVCLGGFLTAAALFEIARQLMSSLWSLFAVLTFLVSPLVFWQVTTSGTPDIWMGFFIGLTVLAASRGIQTSRMRLVVLAGFFSGAAAGVKYTGWVVPLALCAYLLLVRDSRKLAIPCGLASLLSGVLPLLRNLVWTGDPFFPFLVRWLNPGVLNGYALTALMRDTRSTGFSLAPSHLLQFPVLLVVKGDSYGLGQYFGPIGLAFAPLLFLAKWKSPTTRIAGFIWSFGFLANALTTQMGRFLVPIYILLLALVFSGLATAAQLKWRTVTHACWSALVLFWIFGAASDALYARDFLPAAFGLEPRTHFLNRMAPDYQYVSFTNETMKGSLNSGDEKVMVFFRHLYYLQVPFVNGDPTSSWSLDPTKIGEANELFRVLRAERVKWIVKTPGYPTALADAFNKLEAEKRLVPIAASDLQTLTGKSRIYGQRVPVRVTILKVTE